MFLDVQDAWRTFLAALAEFLNSGLSSLLLQLSAFLQSFSFVGA